MTAKEAREISESSAFIEVGKLLNEIKDAAEKSQTSINCNPSDAAIIILRRKGFKVEPALLAISNIGAYCNCVVSWED